MKFAIVSDLHLDFADLPEAFYGNPDNADVLVLAGDTVESRRVHKFEHVFARLSQEYSQVLVINGNHEYYMNNFLRSQRQMEDVCAKFQNVTYLDDSVVDLGDVVVVGSTLWTDYNKNDPLTIQSAVNYMNDYKAIRLESKQYGRMRPSDCQLAHQFSRRYIASVAQQHADKKVVVVTHHAPTFKSIDPRFAGDTQLNGCYASDLSDLMLDNTSIKLWMHGHTHHRVDYEVGQCRVVCNPRGYPGEAIFGDCRPAVVEV